MKRWCHRAVLLAFVAGPVPLGGQRPAPVPGENLQVYLMTMGAGAEIYERFGHNAIWIRDTVAHTDLVYNYGMFTFGRTFADLVGFGARFAMGPQQYWLGYDDLERTLQLYQSVRRDVAAQELNLAPAQRADLAARLATNALEANRYYAYDYFRDNCSTRVRDMLDLELGGALRRAAVGKPADGTLRFHTLRSITNNFALFIFIDAAFGPRVDRPLDQWDEMFLPAKVQQRVRELTVAGPDGREAPLVKRELSMLSINAFHVEPAPPDWGGPLVLASLVVAGLIRLSQSRRGVGMVGRAIGGAWVLLTGLGGVILLFFWVFTSHVATYGNRHLLLLSPLALLLVSSFWFRRGAVPRPWVPRVAMVLMASVAIGVVLAIFPRIAGQQTAVLAEFTALPSFVAALEALRGWNRRQGERVQEAQGGG